MEAGDLNPRQCGSSLTTNQSFLLLKLTNAIGVADHFG